MKIAFELSRIAKSLQAKTEVISENLFSHSSDDMGDKYMYATIIFDPSTNQILGKIEKEEMSPYAKEGKNLVEIVKMGTIDKPDLSKMDKYNSYFKRNRWSIPHNFGHKGTLIQALQEFKDLR